MEDLAELQTKLTLQLMGKKIKKMVVEKEKLEILTECDQKIIVKPDDFPYVCTQFVEELSDSFYDGKVKEVAVSGWCGLQIHLEDGRNCTVSLKGIRKILACQTGNQGKEMLMKIETIQYAPSNRIMNMLYFKLDGQWLFSEFYRDKDAHSVAYEVMIPFFKEVDVPNLPNVRLLLLTNAV